jgi:uncharacterized oxidoreductase
MKLKGNTVLITGGSSGIGLEIAKNLVNNGNTVIICGRSLEKLESAKKVSPSLNIFQCDISVKIECDRLFKFINASFPECNILINNAAVVHKTSFLSDEQMVSKTELEIHTNYLAPVILTKLFLPLLELNTGSKVIYITTGLVYAPKAAYPVYCSTKAALHSFIQTLRVQLKSRNVDIIEVLMPAVDTPFHKGNPPKIAITANKAVQEMFIGLIKGRKEIRIAGVRLIYRISRIAPSLAFRLINKID